MDLLRDIYKLSTIIILISFIITFLIAVDKNVIIIVNYIWFLKYFIIIAIAITIFIIIILSISL